MARQILSPLDFEREFGLVSCNKWAALRHFAQTGMQGRQGERSDVTLPFLARLGNDKGRWNLISEPLETTSRPE